VARDGRRRGGLLGLGGPWNTWLLDELLLRRIRSLLYTWPLLWLLTLPLGLWVVLP
jgi:hypothetical protein